MFITAHSASAAKADLVRYFDRNFREVIDIGTQGDSHGAITVTSGGVSEVRGGKAVGAYSNSQITASILIPGTILGSIFSSIVARTMRPRWV